MSHDPLPSYPMLTKQKYSGLLQKRNTKNLSLKIYDSDYAIDNNIKFNKTEPNISNNNVNAVYVEDFIKNNGNSNKNNTGNSNNCSNNKITYFESDHKNPEDDVNNNISKKLQDFKIPSPTNKLNQSYISKRIPLVTRKSDASIYCLPVTKSTEHSALVNNFDINFKEKKSTLSRNHSLSLSINTSTMSQPLRGRSQTISDSNALAPIVNIPNNKNCNYNTNETNFKTSSNMTKLSNSLNSTSTGKTAWIFPQSEFKLPSTKDNLDPDLIYQEVFKKNVYPNGPLLVIPPNIYLYSEPNVKELLNFDVIINVAEEMPNLNDKIPNNKQNAIDYYHVEWSHRSKISEDLERLTTIMNNASLQNKKILIHCQCGVSRSASLIVAYIMRYFDLNLNDAYCKLKSIAKDISPNMGLIFELMEWNEYLEKITKSKSDGENVKSDNEQNSFSTNGSSPNTSCEFIIETPI